MDGPRSQEQDIVNAICEFLPPKDIISFASTCKGNLITFSHCNMFYTFNVCHFLLINKQRELNLNNEQEWKEINWFKFTNQPTMEKLLPQTKMLNFLEVRLLNRSFMIARNAFRSIKFTNTIYLNKIWKSISGFYLIVI
jgi:hypothetical protein